MLSKKDKDHFKKWLTQRLDESLAKAHKTFTDISDLKDRPSDEMEEASLSADMGFTLRIRDREAKLMAKIAEALDRLENGTFGICEECGEEIPIKRLRARPVTALCIACKRVQEAEERAKAQSLQMSDY